MLKKYEKILDEYHIWHPSLYKRSVECRPSGRYSILVSLDDGSKIEYNSLDNTIREVTQFYIRERADELDEETWRKEFGRNLHRVITERSITQETLSEKTGISRQMLSRYVRGNSTPSGYILNRLANALDCDVRELTSFGYIED
jgi:DNA-binding Xre family transcriptional regulator